MSSLPDIDSLSGLVAYTVSVEKLLYGAGPIDRDVFERLRLMLNALQVACPNHPGVLNARIKWFEIFLNNFEDYVVVPLEKGADVDLDALHRGLSADTHILGSPRTIEHFLRRSYLKSGFPQLYYRVLYLYDRIGSLERLGIQREYFVKTAILLRQKLLDGKL